MRRGKQWKERKGTERTFGQCEAVETREQAVSDHSLPLQLRGTETGDADCFQHFALDVSKGVEIGPIAQGNEDTTELRQLVAFAEVGLELYWSTVTEESRMKAETR